MLYLLTVLIAFVGLAPAADEPSRCTIAGTIFGVDPLGGTLLLKDASGYLKSARLTSATIISKLPVTAGGSITQIRSTDLNNGDLVCVHGGDGDKAPQLSVVPRNDLHRAQTEFLVSWQRNSLYGKLSSIDVSGRTFVVTPLPPSTGDAPVRVSIPASARLRAALPGARHFQESTAFKLEDLKAGEPVYVRGTRGDNAPEMAASMVLKGGYRGILATLVEIQALTSVLKVREFGTGNTFSMKMTPGETYRTTENITHPMRVETAAGVTLAPVGLADLQAGDAILIIGKTAEWASEGEGLVAVTKFGTFGVLPHDPQDRISWLIAK